jgi:hypothetical protein
MLEEGVFAQHVTLAIIFTALLCAGGVGVGAVGSGWVVGLGRRERRVCGCGAGIWGRVGVFGRGCVMGAAAQQLSARLCRLLCRC